MSQLRPLLTCMLLGACAVSACFSCSVINKYDDVVPTKSADGGTNAGGNHSGGNHAGGLDEMAGEGDVPNTGGTSTGGTGGSAPGAIHGLLAVAGTDPTKLDGSVVSLIDPTTGAELARQTITGGAAVAGLAYDGATGKDVWYEFTAATFPAASDSSASLKVFRFTDTGATWDVISSKTLGNLPPPRPHSFVVLNDRLAYLSYTVVSGAPVDSLTVLDTTDPTAVKPIKLTFTLPTGMGVEVLGMVGTRGVLDDETAPGGTLAVLIGNTCTGTHLTRLCGKIQLLPVTVSDDASAGVAVDLSPTLVGEPGFTSAQSTQLGYVAFTPAGLNQSVSLKYFDPRKLSDIKPGAPPDEAHWLGGLAYAECQDVVLFTAVADKTLYASTSAGESHDLPLGHNGQSLVYEPFTGRIITLFNPDNAEFADAPATSSGDGGAGGSDGGMAELDSFNVTSGAVLSRTAAAQWNPPKNLAPNIAVVRFPLSYVCK